MKALNLVFLSFIMIVGLSSCQDELPFDSMQAGELNLEESSTILKPNSRNCGSEALMDRLLQNPEYAEAWRQKWSNREILSASRIDCNAPVLVPVAIHFQGLSNPDRSCLELLASEQIAALNADYQSLNEDLSNWEGGAADYFPNINISGACLEFQIATRNHPTGSGLSDGQAAITINQVNGDFDQDWSGYLNIFVIKNTGYLGYAPLGGDGNGDGVVVDASAFGLGRTCSGVGAEAPFNLGRTLTHEMGHYLFLDHIWGDGCAVDDGIADTPEQANENYGCPGLGISSCGSVDLHMNYMDYTDDACMYMFTGGQVTRMENYLAANLDILVVNASEVLSSGDNTGGGNGEGSDPSCSDGIQNGDETGIDCGGSCLPCDIPEACGSPETLTADKIDQTSYEISWSGSGDAEKFRFRYRMSGESWIGITLMESLFVLEALVPGRTYEYQVRTYCTEGGWQSWSAVAYLTVEDMPVVPPTGGCQLNKVSMALTLDDFGSETRWLLRDADNNLIASGGPYDDFDAGKVISEDFCLPDGCYKFILKDSFGDGICCWYGNGGLVLKDGDGEVIADSDGKFGRRQRINFCIGTGARLQPPSIESDVQLPKSDDKIKRLEHKF